MINDDFVDTTIANLKVIGMVPKNGKLCVRKGQLCLDHIQAQSLRRWINGDSRDMTVMHTKSTFFNAMRIARSIMSCGPAANDTGHVAEWTLCRLLEEIRCCETGLENLKSTYVNDSMMLANLDVIIERRRANISEIEEYIEDHPRYIDEQARGDNSSGSSNSNSNINSSKATAAATGATTIPSKKRSTSDEHARANSLLEKTL